MATLAGETGADVRLVRELGELRDLEDAHPRNGFATLRVLVDLLDLGIVLGADDGVTAETAIHGRQARVFRATCVGVAILTVDAKRSGVDDVVEEDRLLR